MTTIRPSSVAICVLATGGLLLLVALAHALFADVNARLERERLVRDLGLTDLALFTEARYTRHPSQADLHSPFQDHPSSLDHFPSSSLMPPQRNLPSATLHGLPPQGSGS